MPTIWDYNVSLETCGKRIRVQQSGHNITDVIKKVRKDYPDAKMFKVIKKVRARN